VDILAPPFGVSFKTSGHAIAVSSDAAEKPTSFFSSSYCHRPSSSSRLKEGTMTTILILNAISSVLASAGVVGYVLRKERRAARETVVRPLYLSRGRTARRPR
jgi:hypothetical protein